ncbi:MAG: response regulator [Chloroflexota bacterium]
MNAPICVIEDNIPIRKLFTTLLKKAEYEVVDFGNSTDSLAWLKGNNASAIIMDILLPDLNGTELIKIIREMPLHNKVPIIAATGFASTQDQDKLIELGFDYYICKPINTTTFTQEIKSVIEKFKS